MIVAKRKPLDELIAAVEGASRILVAGCGTCVAVCMAGGEKEVALLATELRMALKLRGATPTIAEATVQRQCEGEFVEQLAAAVDGQDVVISLGCGAGTQFLAQRFAPLLPAVRVVPGVNTSFIGVNLDQGYWGEYCQACGDCLLDRTGGICPIARCAKSLLNGPCGGSSAGHCELGEEIPCAWQLIYERLEAAGRLDELETIQRPKDWRTSRDGGPRRLLREEQKIK